MFMVHGHDHGHGHGNGAMSSVCLYECMVCTACIVCIVCTEWVPMYLVGMVSVWCLYGVLYNVSKNSKTVKGPVGCCLLLLRLWDEDV